tara:strand:- start:381 stop:722 length:342 start_codon:yes stop_codon:yes gene_type:complete
MLAADKRALERELAVQINQLRIKELDYLHRSFVALATQSAVLVGFGFMGLNEHTTRVLDDHVSGDESSLSCRNWPNFTAEQWLRLAADVCWATASCGAMAYNVTCFFCRCSRR